MNLSTYENDHRYLAQSKSQPTQPDLSSIAHSRIPVTSGNTGHFNGISYQQSSHRLQYQQIHPNSLMTVGGQAILQPGNSLNLSGLLREPTPEPIVESMKTEPMDALINQDPYADEEFPDIEIQIRNVVCNYTLPLHIDLRRFALSSSNVTYDRGRGVLLKQKRNPSCYVKIYSSGKVYIVGCKSEEDCMRASRSIARHIQRAMGKENEVVKIRNYKVCNVLATCKMPWGVKCEEVAKKYPAEAQYEPELSVGLVWRMKDPKATLRIHTTGSITVTGAQSQDDVGRAIEIIYPIISEFRSYERVKPEKKARKRKGKTTTGPPTKKPTSGAIGNKMYFSDEEDVYDDDDLDELDD